MGNFCPNCGKQINPGETFCGVCGTRLNVSAQPVNQQPAFTAQPVSPQPAFTAQAAYSQPAFAGQIPVSNLPAIGYSSRVNDPEILETVRKQRKSAGIFLFVLVPLPLIGFVLYSVISGDMEMSEALKIGGIVSGVFLLFGLVSLWRGRAAKTYDAVVTFKERRFRRYLNTSSTERRNRVMEYDYIVHYKRDDGRSGRIVESDRGRRLAYEYLQEGDRFRYHPQFAFPYELYDKSRSDGIYCVGCQTKNSLTADRCRKCNLPLLK